MTRPTLSVVVITRNAAEHIRACLESVAFADEWVVVDAASTDATCQLAAACGARVVATTDWPGFGPQKNRALAEAHGDWVLSLDADERVTPELAARIRAVVDGDGGGTSGGASGTRPPAGYELERLSSFCGQWMRHGDWFPDRVLRLVRRGAGRFSDDLVHERLEVDGPVGRLQGQLLHFTLATLDDALDKMNRYSSGRALDRHRAGRRGGLSAAIGHGLWAFLRCYALRLGCLDGRLGLVLALYVAEGTYYRHLKIGLLRAPRWPAPPARADTAE